MVFQSYVVFPHMSVFENIAFGLRMQKLDKEKLTQRLESAAELLHIEDLLQRYPSQVSGGQRQRIAVARAIAMEPEVLLMDEPLSNLDALLRLEMRAELKRLLGEIGSTTVYVTHDQVEAMSMGDRIAVMRAGRILQLGRPLDIYHTPVASWEASSVTHP
jgi:multiple sugar transport system ATP-binding protein